MSRPQPIQTHARVHPTEVVEPEPDFEVPSSDVNRDLGHAFSQYIPQISSRSIKKSASYVGSQLQDELKFMDVNGDFLTGFKIDSIFFPTNDWHGKKRIGELVINLICIQHSGIDNIDFVDFLACAEADRRARYSRYDFQLVNYMGSSIFSVGIHLTCLSLRYHAAVLKTTTYHRCRKCSRRRMI